MLMPRILRLITGVIMKYIELGKSGIKASSIGFGCMRLAGLEVPKVKKMMDKALETGINLFDHADLYAGGECEDLFGKALKLEPSLRDKMVLQSKCGIREGFYDLSEDYILNSVDSILKRLNTDYLDILLLHRPDALMQPEEIAVAIDKLYASGKVKHFGISNSNAMQIQLLKKHVKQPIIVDQVQFSVAHTGLIDAGLNVNMKNSQSLDHDGDLLTWSMINDVTIQCWSPLSYGYFEGTFLNNEKFAKLNQVLEKIGKKNDVSKAAVAIAWILRHPAKIEPMIGFMEEGQIEDLARVAEVELSREEWYEIYLSVGNPLP